MICNYDFNVVWIPNPGQIISIAVNRDLFNLPILCNPTCNQILNCLRSNVFKTALFKICNYILLVSSLLLA